MAVIPPLGRGLFKKFEVGLVNETRGGQGQVIPFLAPLLLCNPVQLLVDPGEQSIGIGG